jgi:hypothetical protein
MDTERERERDAENVYESQGLCDVNAQFTI